MNRDDTVIYAGWMIKSPPQRGLWKIFPAPCRMNKKWRTRYFVLHKPVGSLHDEYMLSYYSQKDCRKCKGEINLAQCEQIIESLNSDQYPYVLAIKTFFKRKERTYFLATETEEEMTLWVRNLCTVCGLKQEDNPSPTDIPPQTGNNTEEQKSKPVNAVLPNNHINTPVTVQPVSVSPPSLNACARPLKPVPDERESYIPINECTTGSKALSLDTGKRRKESERSTSSMPEELAPPPPAKGRTENGHMNDDDVGGIELYDVPPSHHTLSDDEVINTYKSPPSRPKDNQNNSPRSSSSSGSRLSDSSPLYDYPKDGRAVTPPQVYDYPPQQAQDVPPVVPPRPAYTEEPAGPYHNLPSNSKIVMDLGDVPKPPPPHISTIRGELDELYKMPVPREKSILITPPPPAHCGSMKKVPHSYVNAGTTYVEQQESSYIGMDRGGNTSVGSPSSTFDVEYTDMSGRHTLGTSVEYSNMSKGNNVGVYQVPPPPKVHATTQKYGTNKASALIDRNPEGPTSVFSSSRTRSFKRHGSASSSSAVDHHVKRPIAIPLPVANDNSSSEEEEDTHFDDSQMWSSPPAPGKQDAELKYLDLDLDELPTEPEVSKQRVSPQPQSLSTPTEYREIDFVKTQALTDLQQQTLRERKHEDH